MEEKWTEGDSTFGPKSRRLRSSANEALLSISLINFGLTSNLSFFRRSEQKDINADREEMPVK